ncbi:HD domain-containing phosphohydrolase [Alkalimonas mucilaginosa]|uniref:HD domain-containing protein n=1 Tax=Alkalimonas mucilaginosa TaxID=3057676 RepID=A0ABU7JJ73_9GAMM|nr:HD domain-containing phosphohydrolase [Alkalimonas sp. MEB004]MEE2025491.1 HD domain-containing protein [Alkalimonas sp. MEB004]
MLHDAALKVLGQTTSLVEKLQHIHDYLKRHHAFISRIAIALYDPSTDMVRTFIYSGEKTPLNHYHARLSGCYSLQQLAVQRKARLEQDLSVFNGSQHLHAQRIYAAGFRGSYTIPMIWGNELLGFLFFNSQQINAFDDFAIENMDVAGHLVTLMLYNERAQIKTLSATLKSALDLTHSRDPETGAHLERMSRYARLIARHCADAFHLDDHFIEHVFLFAPLHDLGKMAIPDKVLLKPGPLTEEEFNVMKTHSEAGLAMVDKLMENYGLSGLSHLSVLRNIVMHHHEAMDGSGYPSGLQGDAIPIEARIVTVADVFDALTSRRPYKEAWTNQQAFAQLQRLSGTKFDGRCVQAILDNAAEVAQIQASFNDNVFG